MSSIINLLSFYSDVKFYPIKLANQIGVSNAALLWSLVLANKDKNFDFVRTLDKASFDFLLYDQYILITEDQINPFKINIEKLENITGELIPKVIQKIKPPFENKEFLELCDKFLYKLKKANRPKTISSLYGCFENRTLEESIKALRLSINNNYVSLIFEKDGDSKANYKEDRSRGRIGNSGGQKNDTEKRDLSKFTRKVE